MKRIISAMLAVILCVLTLSGCEKVQGESAGEGAESGASESGVASGEEESGESEDEIPFLNFENEKAFWQEHYSEYRILNDAHWVNDRYFFLPIEHMKDGTNRILFLDAMQNDIIECGSFEPDFFNSSPDFSKRASQFISFVQDDYFYILTNDSTFLKISLLNFEYSFEDAAIVSFWKNKTKNNDYFISFKGTVAELPNEYTVILYNILSPKDQTVIDVSDILEYGIMLNAHVEWSDNGKYFMVLNRHPCYATHDLMGVEAIFSVFDEKGNFIRFVCGNNSAWDSDSIWLLNDHRKDLDQFRIFSLTNPDEVATLKDFDFSYTFRYCVCNGYFYLDQIDEARTKFTVIKGDVRTGKLTPTVEYARDAGGYSVSPDGRYLAFIHTFYWGGDKKPYFFLIVDTN